MTAPPCRKCGHLAHPDRYCRHWDMTLRLECKCINYEPQPAPLAPPAQDDHGEEEPFGPE